MADHNYQREIARLQEQGIFKPGEVLMINVMHDDWCGIYSGKRCDCNPDIRNQATERILNQR